jgi:hypothetical protein
MQYYSDSEVAWLSSIDPWFDYNLHPRPCTRRRCDCYIAYAHRPDLPFISTLGAGLLLRR